MLGYIGFGVWGFIFDSSIVMYYERVFSRE